MKQSVAGRLKIAFDNSYARLPEGFFELRAPTPVEDPSLIKVNHALAEVLGLNPDDLETAQGVSLLAGNHVPESAAPLAMAYAGHQFGNFVPQLGDGRAILLGEIVGTDGIRRDIQLKGSGRTAFSRMGDGRAGVGPVLREYIVSEAMHALAIPTTRSLAAVRTGEAVMRERPMPGAVLTRVSQSHLRVGTFQYFAARGNTDALKVLTDYAIDRLFPEAAEADQPAAAFFERVLGGQATLIAKWMLAGFIHGVMNTDNTSIAGETIDYGPCAFMEAYHPGTVFSSIDRNGRYAFGNQPAIAHWNLVQLVQCLLPLLHSDPDKAIAQAQSMVDTYPDLFEQALAAEFRRKLGLATKESGDRDLGQGLLDLMAHKQADFTLTFRGLAELVGTGAPAQAKAGELFFKDPEVIEGWVERYQSRLERDPLSSEDRAARLRAVNPLYMPRNHLLEDVIRSAEDGADFEPFETLMSVLADPFTERAGLERFARPAKPEERVLQTFCGT
ncbi:YdiU family protein [Roseibium sp. RKSG952]|uniref:protein adenylyltransferase SelO n=1 Tax=Roseibium sp. RKSG952 TaxID=2529384 RepID=UPI0012BC70A9|nr:YdiU family protein [Roseibium sp. RKSG952]MTI00156.1 YdiU family protein [Roseibium sp. RKSG952]